jgi:hypothetical protein
LAKIVLRKKPEVLQKMALFDAVLLKSSPVFLVYSSRVPLKGLNGIEAGRLVERAWLKLTEDNYVAHPMYAAIQDPAGRERLHDILDLKEYKPYFFMRIGEPTANVSKTPRDPSRCS